jgi:hypothetical protein
VPVPERDGDGVTVLLALGDALVEVVRVPRAERDTHEAVRPPRDGQTAHEVT